MGELPISVIEAMSEGEITQEQLRQLITAEAEALSMDFDEAVSRARQGSLPKNAIGADIELLVELLAA
jgi:hypothetical protein